MHTLVKQSGGTTVRQVERKAVFTAAVALQHPRQLLQSSGAAAIAAAASRRPANASALPAAVSPVSPGTSHGTGSAVSNRQWPAADTSLGSFV